VLISFAQATPRGTIALGDVVPLAAAVDSGLGWSELGIRLGPAPKPWFASP
jgi:hypothetical protein